MSSTGLGSAAVVDTDSLAMNASLVDLDRLNAGHPRGKVRLQIPWNAGETRL
jgi:hypothetical protein